MGTHDPMLDEDSFAECRALLKMHGHDNDPEDFEERLDGQPCLGCPVKQCCLSYHQQMKLPLDVQTLFKDVMFQMNLKYKQHLPQKGHSWMGEKSSSMRKLLFAEFKEFKAAVFAAGTKEEDRIGELIDVLLLGMMTAQQWIQELWKEKNED